MSERTKKKKKNKDKVLTPYLTKPLLYFLIGMLLILPLAFGSLSAAVKVVHKAQPHFAKTTYEVTLNNSAFTPSSATSGTVSLPVLKTGDLVGNMACSDKGLNTDVYYGANRVSYRTDVGISAKSGLPGQGQEIDVKGYAGTGFKALENLEEEDVITFTTSWGTYQYEVISAEVTAEPVKEDGELLVLSTARSKAVFANFAEEKLYVTARLLSGPTAEEVAQ